jgi:hypothetical protein
VRERERAPGEGRRRTPAPHCAGLRG